MKRIAVFPGSFDPFTKGHESVVKKALTLFDEVIVAIGYNTSKVYLFDIEDRKNHIRSIFKDERVIVETFDGLTVDYCKKKNAQFIVRGLRDTKDFEYEKNIAQMNVDISGIESVFFMTEPQFAAINATIVREIYKSGGEIDLFVTNSELLVIK